MTTDATTSESPADAVEAAWESLREDMNDLRFGATTVMREIAVDSFIARHRPLIEAAVRKPLQDAMRVMEWEEDHRELDRGRLALALSEYEDGDIRRPSPRLMTRLLGDAERLAAIYDRLAAARLSATPDTTEDQR